MRETFANHISEEEKISKMFVSHPVMPDSLRPHELWLIRLLCPWNSPGKNTGEYWSGVPFPSPEDLPNPGSKPGSPPLQADSLLSEPPGKSYDPAILLLGIYPESKSEK